MPLFGALFRAETEEERTSELVVFITTKVLTRPVLSEAEEVQLDNFDFLMPRKTEKRLRPAAQVNAETKQEEVADPEEIIDMWIKKEKDGQ